MSLDTARKVRAPHPTPISLIETRFTFAKHV